MLNISRITMPYVALVCATACSVVAAGNRDHARQNLSSNLVMSSEAIVGEPEMTFVLGDLKIEGDVHDRDGVITRVLKTWKDREYDDAKDLRDAVAEGIRTDFQERGYFMVLVHEPASQPLGRVDDKQRMLIVTSITEGEQFRLGTVNIENAVPDRELIIPAATLREQFHLRRDGLFSVPEVRAGLERLNGLYVARGYTDFTAAPETKIDNESHHIDLIIRITEGPHKP
jgi:outer membrane protein assembly factor BamA